MNKITSSDCISLTKFGLISLPNSQPDCICNQSMKIILCRICGYLMKG